jgi:hypothetical protein
LRPAEDDGIVIAGRVDWSVGTTHEENATTRSQEQRTIRKANGVTMTFPSEYVMACAFHRLADGGSRCQM